VSEDARRAAQLAKADLVSGMVGEFPELQGLMGRYYAEAGGIKPESPAPSSCTTSPRRPTRAAGAAGRCGGDRRPWQTSSTRWWASVHRRENQQGGDPYQLRRAALGMIRIVLERRLEVAALPVTGGAPATGTFITVGV
jgi:glycyl-tRNA synthetase beta chain